MQRMMHKRKYDSLQNCKTNNENNNIIKMPHITGTALKSTNSRCKVHALLQNISNFRKNKNVFKS